MILFLREKIAGGGSFLAGLDFLHIAQLKVECLDRKQDFPKRNGQGDHHQDQAEAKYYLSGQEVAGKQDKQAEYTGKQAGDPKRLHISDEVDAFSEAFNLSDQDVIGIFSVL